MMPALVLNPGLESISLHLVDGPWQPELAAAAAPWGLTADFSAIREPGKALAGSAPYGPVWEFSVWNRYPMTDEAGDGREQHPGRGQCIAHPLARGFRPGPPLTAYRPPRPRRRCSTSSTGSTPLSCTTWPPVSSPSTISTRCTYARTCSSGVSTKPAPTGVFRGGSRRPHHRPAAALERPRAARPQRPGVEQPRCGRLARTVVTGRSPHQRTRQ